MGCKVSKSVAVRENNSGVARPTPNNSNHSNNSNCSGSGSSCNNGNDITTRNQQEDDINVFVDAPNVDNEGVNVNTCDNAKPRLLRSAILRNPQNAVIRPVVVNESPIEGDVIDDADEYIVISSSSSHHNRLTNVSRCSDSGLGHTIASSSHFSDNAEIPPESSTVTTPTSYPNNNSCRTPCFGTTLTDSSSVTRLDSARTGSIITTNALNASFMTTGDEDFAYNVDVSLDLHTPFSEYTADADESTFRTLSITPAMTSAVSVESMPIIMHNKRIGVIQEESEGGFTPRSIDCNENLKSVPHTHVQNGIGILPTYLPRDVLSHNKQSDFKEWIIHKRKVYDTNLIIFTFSAIVAEYVECKVQETARLKLEMGREREDNEKLRNETIDNNTHDDNSDSDSDENDTSSWANDEYCEEYEINKQIIDYGNDFENRQTWNRFGMRTLMRLDLKRDVIDLNLLSCCIGEIVQPNSPRYWDDVRKDVRVVVDHMNRSDARDELTNNEIELKEQLQGWLKLYNTHNPQLLPLPPSDVDPNQSTFPLPMRIQENPESLRHWIEKFVEFDTEIPDSGAWTWYEIEDVDLGDPDEIFKATLRSDGEDGDPLNHAIDDEAAWQVFPSNLVADDKMTLEQEAVEVSRRYRHDLHDPKRMERRRNKLLNYFILKYELQIDDVSHFERWASALEEGDRKFKALCGLI